MSTTNDHSAATTAPGATALSTARAGNRHPRQPVDKIPPALERRCIRAGGWARCTLFAVIVLTAAACASAVPVLRDPRRLVIHSGERLAPTRERMEEIDVWVTEQWDSIRDDFSFMINHGPQEGPTYLWETLELNEAEDTANIYYQGRPGLVPVYVFYAHLHLMAAQDRLDRWLPEADGGTTYEIERAILARVADVWLYQRSIFDVRPYDFLEELLYSKENDHLDAYILTARPDEFVDARRTWMEENPGARDAFIAWFRTAFERDPPGMRGGTGER